MPAPYQASWRTGQKLNRQPTSLMASPLRLWPTNIIGRCYFLYISFSSLNAMEAQLDILYPTLNLLTISPRNIAISPSNVSEWPKIISLLAYFKAFATPESYPQVIIRAFGISSLRISQGQQTRPLDQVSRACPRNPWTKTILLRLVCLIRMGGDEFTQQLFHLLLRERRSPAEPCQMTLLLGLHLS